MSVTPTPHTTAAGGSPAIEALQPDRLIRAGTVDRARSVAEFTDFLEMATAPR
jgi:hypothetical protein